MTRKNSREIKRNPDWLTDDAGDDGGEESMQVRIRKRHVDKDGDVVRTYFEKSSSSTAAPDVTVIETEVETDWPVVPSEQRGTTVLNLSSVFSRPFVSVSEGFNRATKSRTSNHTSRDPRHGLPALSGWVRRP